MTMPAVAGRALIVTLQNRVGSVVDRGTCLIQDTAHDSAFVLTTTSADKRFIGFAAQEFADLESGRVQVEGTCLALVHGAVTRGHFLKPSTTTGHIDDTGTAVGATTDVPSGACAIALASGTDGQLVSVRIVPAGAAAIVIPVPTQGDFDGDTLDFGPLVDGEFLKRDGTTIVSEALVTGPATQIIETSGPDTLDIGGIADGEYLRRVGMTIVSGTPSGGGGFGATERFINEIRNFPKKEGALTTLPWWWSKSSLAACTEVNSLTEVSDDTYGKKAHKVVTTGANEYHAQRYTYADEPRLRSGLDVSLYYAVWAVGGASCRIRLADSTGSIAASSDTTTGAWVLKKIENVAIAGTWLEIREEVDTGTGVFIPLGLCIGDTALILKPRGLIYKSSAAPSVLSTTTTATTWLTCDCTSGAGPLAVIGHINFYYFATGNVTAEWRRFGDSGVAGGSGLLSVIAQPINSVSAGRSSQLLDDQQRFEMYFSAAMTSVSVSLAGWEEWE